MRVGWVVLVAASLLSEQVAAQAAPSKAAPSKATAASYQALIDDALGEYEAHNFEEALALFNKAHALSPNARSLRAMALAEYELRRYVPCLGHLQEALASTVKPITGALRRETEVFVRKAQQYVSRVVVDVSPATARPRVALDDGAWVALPADGALVLQVGEHVLAVEAEGFESTRQTFVVEAGGEQSLSIALRPKAAAVELAVSPSVVAVPATANAGTSPAPAPAASMWESPWLWSGVGAVVIGGAALVLLSTQAGGTTTADAYQGNLGTLKGPSNP